MKCHHNLLPLQRNFSFSKSLSSNSSLIPIRNEFNAKSADGVRSARSVSFDPISVSYTHPNAVQISFNG